MDVLIKGMEMPKNGVNLYISSDGSVDINSPIGRCIMDAYKAVELPPHGRLIDANVAYDKIAEQEGGNYVDMDAVDLGLQETPTVLEAST